MSSMTLFDAWPFDVPAPAEFTHSPFMLPRTVTFVNVRISCQCLKNLAVEKTAGMPFGISGDKSQISNI